MVGHEANLAIVAVAWQVGRRAAVAFRVGGDGGDRFRGAGDRSYHFSSISPAFGDHRIDCSPCFRYDPRIGHSSGFSFSVVCRVGGNRRDPLKRLSGNFLPNS